MTKKRILSTLALVAVASSAAHAEILTVDNNPGSVAMYTTTTAAYEASSDGDTILVTGSPTPYAALTIYKQLTVIGSGYFLGTAANQNNLPGLVNNSTSLSLYFRTDLLTGSSSNSRAVGISGRIRSDSGVDGLVVERCWVNSSSTFGGKTVLRGCYCPAGSAVTIGDGSLVTNSILANLSLGLGSAADHCVIERLRAFSSGASIGNSIFMTSTATPLVGSISNSMAVGNSILPQGAGNLNDQAFLDVFVTSTSLDGRWQLKQGSPAIGAGSAGADMGAFGGTTPYVLSGVPKNPRITRLVVPATATSTSGLRFEVDAQIVAE